MASTEKIIFLDTNVVVPKSSWDIYTYRLNSYKDRKRGILSRNRSIIEKCIENAMVDAESMKDFLKGNEDVRFTGGVIYQSEPVLEAIIDNVSRRKQCYMMTEFSQAVADEERDRSSMIYRNLTRYAGVLGEIKKEMIQNQYVSPSDMRLNTIVAFLNELDNTYFNISKEVHNFDFGTDIEIASSAIYESLINGKEAKVISNDCDVNRFVGTFLALFDRMKPAFEEDPLFSNVYQNPPKGYVYLDKRGAPEEKDLRSMGEEIIREFKAYNYGDEIKSKEVSDDARKQHDSYVGRFSRVLEQFYDRMNFFSNNISKTNHF